VYVYIDWWRFEIVVLDYNKETTNFIDFDAPREEIELLKECLEEAVKIIKES